MQSADLKPEEYNNYERELRDISVVIMTRLRCGRREIRASISGNDQRFISSPQRPLQLWLRRVSLQYLTWAPFPSLQWPERKTHLHLEPTLIIGGATAPVPHTPRCRSA